MLDIKESNNTECPRCLFNKDNYPNIIIYEDGCSVCKDYDIRKKQHDNILDNKDQKLKVLIDEIKHKNGKYDCVIGLSGGVDSSYVALKIKELGLRPIAVHLDNGWNSNDAVTNINNIVSKLGIDLYTYVIDWNEFKEMQKAYFSASVVDIEVLTDHAITSVMKRVANKYNIKYILSGTNFSTESILPMDWFFSKNDYVNIIDIVSKNSDIVIKSYPVLKWLKRTYYNKIKGIKSISFLDFLDYNKSDALIELETKINYIKYPQKHFESIFTRFYQGYILPKKFNIDKRVAHLSSLVVSNQLTRDEGLMLLLNNEYDENSKQQDYEYVRKKLEFTKEEFEEYFIAKPVKHEYYKIERSIKDILLFR